MSVSCRIACCRRVPREHLCTPPAGERVRTTVSASAWSLLSFPTGLAPRPAAECTAPFATILTAVTAAMAVSVTVRGWGRYRDGRSKWQCRRSAAGRCRRSPCAAPTLSPPPHPFAGAAQFCRTLRDHTFGPVASKCPTPLCQMSTVASVRTWRRTSVHSQISISSPPCCR